jgi:hypothetical protein
MLGEVVFEREDEPPHDPRVPWKGFSYIKNRLISLAVSSSTSFGRRDAGGISIIRIPAGKSFNKPA